MYSLFENRPMVDLEGGFVAATSDLAAFSFILFLKIDKLSILKEALQL